MKITSQSIGLKVKSDYPIKEYNPNDPFIIVEVCTINGFMHAKGKCTIWFHENFLDLD